MKANIIATDTHAQGGVVSFFIGLMIAVLIALQVTWPVMDDAIYGGEGTAVGIFTFTGNVSNGELVNITNGASVYRLEFNVTANGSTSNCVTANCIVVPLNEKEGTAIHTFFHAYNTSVRASGNLTAAINANASLAALVTAANTTNKTTITAKGVGTSYNTIATADNAASAAWGSTTLVGGGDKVTQNMSSASTTLLDQLPLFLVLVLLMVFVKAVM